eukprot:gene1425-biopygen12330
MSTHQSPVKTLGKHDFWSFIHGQAHITGCGLHNTGCRSHNNTTGPQNRPTHNRPTTNANNRHDDPDDKPTDGTTKGQGRRTQRDADNRTEPRKPHIQFPFCIHPPGARPLLPSQEPFGSRCRLS